MLIFSFKIGFSYMFTFIAKAKNTGFLTETAERIVVSISSAIPFATLPIILYVAGAIKTISAQSASEICSTS